MADENDVDDDASPAAAAPEGEDVLIAPEAGARVGLPPGELRLPDELVYAGVPRVRITVYDAAGVETFDAASAADIPGPRVEGKTVWVSVEGLADLALFRSLQRTFCIH
ncbi:MAG TPA: hypothetical protein VEI02_03655, partial [Planctomycetota bacterium]|nr:hypothetical protein [Planctomycetota bacterium]